MWAEKWTIMQEASGKLWTYGDLGHIDIGVPECYKFLLQVIRFGARGFHLPYLIPKRVLIQFHEMFLGNDSTIAARVAYGIRIVQISADATGNR